MEHVSIVRDDQIARLAGLRLIASVQHSWFHAGAAKTLTRWLGRDRRALAGRWRDLIDADIQLTGGTDRPYAIVGESGDSMDAIAEAVTRVGPSGRRPPRWMRSQAMTVLEVLRSLTIDAAFA
ncbi:MAG: amidohydrolase family protein [Actinomycetota bacterium]